MRETISEELSYELVVTLRKLALDGKARTDARHELHFEGVPYDNSAERSANREIKERLAGVNPFLAAVIERLYDAEKQFLPHDIPQGDRIEDTALDIIENVVSIKLPRALRNFYTKIGNGGVGPGLGIYSTGDLLERYRWSVFDQVGPQGQQWPKHLLPICGDDWDCISIDLIQGTLVRCEVGLLQIEPASGQQGRWGYSFNWVAPSLEEWLRKWLKNVGMPLPEQPPQAESVTATAAPAPPPKLPGSTDYLKRYKDGECKAVWSELVQLGDAVMGEPLRTEALEVARETMSRARRNIEKIVNRLEGLGYRFGNEPSDPLPAKDARVFMGAPANASQLINQLEEELRGPLPLSLRAFYEQVGSVSLIGSHELLNPPYRGQDLADPLLLFGIEDLIEQLDEIPPEEREDEAELTIAPDDLTKADVSGSFYYVYLPFAAADFAFNHFRDGGFVDYLRLTFKWGGFPGWERYSNPPTEQIAILTENLERI